MNQIRVYVNNVFAAIPDTPEAREMKRNILESMEDAYQELREQGKSENEALGQVISQFGSVEEIREALGLLEQDSADSFSASAQDFSASLSPDLLEEYMLFRQRYGMMIALGVALCVLGLAAFMFMEGLLGDNAAIGVLCLFLSAGAAILIYTSVQKESWDKLEKNWKKGKQSAPADPPLKSSDSKKDKKEAKKRIKRKAENLSGVIMLAATLIFFVGGFCFDKWGVVWVVFPIGGVLCALMEEILGLFET